MRLQLVLATAFSTLTLTSGAKGVRVPDYFPAPKGGEWTYRLTTSKGTSVDVRRVVSDVVPSADGKSQTVVITSTSPVEVVETYRKTSGWVLTDKSVTPSVDYTFDYDKDLTTLMNPLVAGKHWTYEGSAGGLSLTQDWNCVGPERVTVQGGDFKAVKVTSNLGLRWKRCQVHPMVRGRCGPCEKRHRGRGAHFDRRASKTRPAEMTRLRALNTLATSWRTEWGTMAS